MLEGKGASEHTIETRREDATIRREGMRSSSAIVRRCASQFFVNSGIAASPVSAYLMCDGFVTGFTRRSVIIV
jgi:hypothetical protein